MKRQKRFEELEKRPIHLDGFVKEWPDEGFVAMMGPNDPKPSIKIENGVVTELDSKKRADFDLIDLYIGKFCFYLDKAEEFMAMDSTKIANILVDPNVARKDLFEITTAMTPAKAEEVISKLDFGEMIMATKKMRPRRTPATQCHVTNTLDNPVEIAADAADAALRGFPEQETTTAVARYAPLNAISILVGSQTGRPGVLTQCSVEEAAELSLGMRGFTSYAETVSVYGTDRVFTDGDDTPWSKGFLASCYASRGLKMRFTSGSGSEVLMGYTEGKSMLYLEARCIYITKASGVQGLQNGGVSCIGIPGAVPSGIRSVLGENLLCMMVDLECASGNFLTPICGGPNGCWVNSLLERIIFLRVILQYLIMIILLLVLMWMPWTTMIIMSWNVIYASMVGSIPQKKAILLRLGIKRLRHYKQFLMT